MMSDTFGAEDETASGGLQSDMPEIGTAPPTQRFVPSALGSLASSFFGGRPAPQPARMGRSPFQFPGQSQIPQGPAGAMPGGERWGGTTASLALPRDSPQPRLNFTPFQRSLPTRGPSEWGTAEEYARLPASFEIPSIYHGVSQFFGQNGSLLSIPLALGLGRNANAFIEGLMKGQEWKAKMARQQMLDNALKLQVQEEEQHRRYGDTLARYEAINETSDWTKLTKGIGGVSVRDALYQDALDMQDEKMISMIESGANVADIARYQQLRDANLHDLQKANAKNAEQTEDDSAFTGGVQIGGQGQGQVPARPTSPLALTGPGTVTAAGQPAPSAAAQPTPPSEGTPEDALITATARTGAFPAELAHSNPRLAQQVWARAYDQLNRLGNLSKSGTSVSPSAVATQGPDGRWHVSDAVNSTNAAIGADLERVLNYDSPLGGGQGGQGAAPGARSGQYSDLLGNLAHKANPDWSQAFYQAQENFRTNPQTQTVLLRSNALAADGKAVRDDLKELEKSGRATTGLDLNQIVSMAERDPLYAKLYGDWLAYNDAFNTIVTGGRHVESGTMAQVSTAPTYYASPAAFRATMKGHMNDVYGMIEGEHQRWETIGGRKNNMPSYNPKTEKEISDMRDMDWLTGTLPGETYTVKGVTKTWAPKNSLDPHDPANWQ